MMICSYTLSKIIILPLLKRCVRAMCIFRALFTTNNNVSKPPTFFSGKANENFEVVSRFLNLVVSRSSSIEQRSSKICNRRGFYVWEEKNDDIFLIVPWNRTIFRAGKNIYYFYRQNSKQIGTATAASTCYPVVGAPRRREEWGLVTVQKWRLKNVRAPQRGCSQVN